MKRLATALGWALVAAAGAGCGTRPARVPSRPPAPVDAPTDMVVRTPPTAVNWDDRPGADGIPVLVHLFRRPDGSLPVMVRGRIRFDLYEGILRPEDISAASPWRTWQFQGEQLRLRAVRTPEGWGYAFRLDFSNAPPATSAVTVVTRYVGPDGRTVLVERTVLPTSPRRR